MAPRSWPALERLIGVATPSQESDLPPRPTALPSGPSADAETIAAIEATVYELGARANAGDVQRLFALCTDRYLGEIGPYDAAVFSGDLATPAAVEDRLSIDATTNVQRLDDGRVTAVVVIGNWVDRDPAPGRINLYLFAQKGDRGHVDTEIEQTATLEGFRSVASLVGTPTP